MAFWKKLRMLIDERGLTQKQLALELRIPASTLGVTCRARALRITKCWLQSRISSMSLWIFCCHILLQIRGMKRRKICCVFTAYYPRRNGWFIWNREKLLSEPNRIMTHYKRKRGRNRLTALPRFCLCSYRLFSRLYFVVPAALILFSMLQWGRGWLP